MIRRKIDKFNNASSQVFVKQLDKKQQFIAEKKYMYKRIFSDRLLNDKVIKKNQQKIIDLF